MAATRSCARDAPDVANPAFFGQYAQGPDDVVCSVECSNHAAALAVEGLLGAPHRLPPAYQGLEHPNALVGAIRRIPA